MNDAERDPEQAGNGTLETTENPLPEPKTDDNVVNADYKVKDE